MTPEEKARVKIDKMFDEAGWKVVNREDFSPTITAAAIREGLLKGNLEADYFLFINGKAVGVLEAKREEVNVDSSSVHDQVEHYIKSVPNCYQTYSNPYLWLICLMVMTYSLETIEKNFLDMTLSDEYTHPRRSQIY